MKRIFLVFLILAAGGLWWAWNTQPAIRSSIEQYIENGELLTLEARYTADSIMDKHRRELLEDSKHTFQEPSLKLYPYLLMDVKYMQPDKKTRESSILWSLADGEMVIDTESWETTHGFEDAINADANRSDFRIMQALANRGGSMTRDELLDELRIDSDLLGPSLKTVCDKQLVACSGDRYILHFQNPKIQVTPQTKVKHAIVTKPAGRFIERANRKYSAYQIERIAKAAFGPTFTIRKSQEVFLPVHLIAILNPDNTIHTTHWNAITGQKIK